MEAPHSPEVGEQLPVQVLLRLRPLTGQQRDTIVVHAGPRTLKICNPVQSVSANGESLVVSKRMEYTFDWVLNETSSQIDTFRKSCPSMLRHFFGGGNALLFCYGPSGSGKTHTVLGNDKEPGLLPNILKSVFASIEAANSVNAGTPVPSNKASMDAPVYPLLPGMEYSVWVSYLECYNERVYDLLRKKENGSAHRGGGEAPVALDIKYTKNHVPIIPSNEPTVINFQQAMQCVHNGNLNRQVGATQINKTSSRGHTIFTIKLTQTPIGATQADIQADPSIVRYSKFSIVDLAGSERSSKSQATGDRLREASNINNSLLTLKRCMKALQQNQLAIQQQSSQAGASQPVSRRTSVDKGLGSLTDKANNNNKPLEVIPFRDSTLTKLLREYLQGEGKCSVIVNIHPAPSDYEESLQALDFGTITKAVKTTTCKKKIVSRSASPPQPIPFSLTQALANSKVPTGVPPSASAQRSHHQATSQNLFQRLERLVSSTNATNPPNIITASSITAANTSAHNNAPSINETSMVTSTTTMMMMTDTPSSTPRDISPTATSTIPDDDTIVIHSSNVSFAPESITEGDITRGIDEVSSPSKSALNRTRILLQTQSPAHSKRLSFSHSQDIASSLEKQIGDHNTNDDTNQMREDEDADLHLSDNEDDMGWTYDERDLINEVNRLRLALLEAENRGLEIEMSLRSELAEQMSTRVNNLCSFFKAQMQERIQDVHAHYSKVLAHYEKEFDAQQAHHVMKLSEMEAQTQSEAFSVVLEKDALLQQLRDELEFTKVVLKQANQRVETMHEETRIRVQREKDAHREELTLLRMKLERLEREVASTRSTATSGQSSSSLVEDVTSSLASKLPTQPPQDAASKEVSTEPSSLEESAPATTKSYASKKKRASEKSQKSRAGRRNAVTEAVKEEAAAEQAPTNITVGRKPKFGRAMTSAERMRLYRLNQKQRKDNIDANDEVRTEVGLDLLFDPSLDDTRPSTIKAAGLGVFVTRDVDAGTILTRHLDTLVDIEDLNKMATEQFNSPSTQSLAGNTASAANITTTTTIPPATTQSTEKQANTAKNDESLSSPPSSTTSIESEVVDLVHSSNDKQNESKRRSESKKRRHGESKDVAPPTKVSKLKEHTAPSASSTSPTPDPFEFPGEIGDDILELLEVEDSTKRMKKGRFGGTRSITKFTDTRASSVLKASALLKSSPAAMSELSEVADEVFEDEDVEDVVVGDDENDDDDSYDGGDNGTKKAVKKGTTKKSSSKSRPPSAVLSPKLVRRNGKKTMEVDFGEDDDYEENVDNVTNARETVPRTPLAKRLRARRPTELLESPVAEDTHAPLRRSSRATAANAKVKRRGASTAPRYLGNFI